MDERDPDQANKAQAIDLTKTRMLTAFIHFILGLLAIGAITYTHAHLLNETNASFISAGLIAGVICACLATFLTQWATPIVILLLGASSHREYLQSKKHALTPQEQHE
ncbi:hypothetical protein [Thiorhodococcus minor]|uniref:Uncharacterized protein n=1 Tax=Thiorhodococcus minor TaxID=57489 RepID=A0A6M0JWH9_9GAMM|nr:hypothetical protein [Thiorhodococcus minor]NEV61860.1 hypothetical protein [Thiorhodococcus minor]